MKTHTIETLKTADLDDVTGGCAACGNPQHASTLSNAPQQWGQQAGQQAGQWAGRLFGRR